MDRNEVVKKAEEALDKEGMEQEVAKCKKLIAKIRESKSALAENEKALADYLVGKPLIRLQEDPFGNILITNGYQANGSNYISIQA